jgi:isopenicillin-N epimerase
MWRFLSRERGFRYLNRSMLLPLTSASEFVEAFWGGVTSSTRAIFLSHITSPTAIIFPVEEILRRARQAGILTIVDGAHAPGQIALQLGSLGADFYGGNLHKWLCAPKGAGFLYARPEARALLKPLVVSWGYEPETPSDSVFIDQQEWWGTRDIAAFLSVPAAIEFQKEHDWDEVRADCHALARDAQARICALTGLDPLHPDDAAWYGQMAAAQLPAGTDIGLLKTRLYEQFGVEVPFVHWNGRKLIRVSVQGYNTAADIDTLLDGLRSLVRSD